MIETATIDDQPCKVQYLDLDLIPTHKSNHTFQYIKFGSGKYGYRTHSSDPCVHHILNSINTKAMLD